MALWKTFYRKETKQACFQGKHWQNKSQDFHAETGLLEHWCVHIHCEADNFPIWSLDFSHWWYNFFYIEQWNVSTFVRFSTSPMHDIQNHEQSFKSSELGFWHLHLNQPLRNYHLFSIVSKKNPHLSKKKLKHSLFSSALSVWVCTFFIHGNQNNVISEWMQMPDETPAVFY